MIYIDIYPRTQTQRKLGLKADPYYERHPCEPTVRGTPHPMVFGSSLSHNLPFPTSSLFVYQPQQPLFVPHGPQGRASSAPAWTLDQVQNNQVLSYPSSQVRGQLLEEAFPEQLCDFCFYPWQPGWGLTRNEELTNTLGSGGWLHCSSWDTERAVSLMVMQA